MLFVVLFLMANVLSATCRHEGFAPATAVEGECRFHEGTTFYWHIQKNGVFPTTRAWILEPVSNRSIAAVYEQKTWSKEGDFVLTAEGNERVSITVQEEGPVRFTYTNICTGCNITHDWSPIWYADKVRDSSPETLCVCWGDKESAKVLWFEYSHHDNQRGYFRGGEIIYDTLHQPKLLWGLARYDGQVNCQGTYQREMPLCFGDAIHNPTALETIELQAALLHCDPYLGWCAVPGNAHVC